MNKSPTSTSKFLPCLRNSLRHLCPQGGHPVELSLTLSTFKAKVPIPQDTYIKEPWIVLDIISRSTDPIHFLQLPQANFQTPIPQHHEICRIIGSYWSGQLPYRSSSVSIDEIAS
ncbi:hypothetical protein SK128_019074 [Halocaridina rubra]|uniref:Uncharacterized protein n=1 Tax=Halocaridina rubra TaxID=373956 RepID=A0AAN9A790_HALRR